MAPHNIESAATPSPKNSNVIDPELAWRFVLGIVDKVDGDLVRMTVNVPEKPEITQVRLQIDPAKKSDYSPGASRPLFLIDAIPDIKGLWRTVDDGMAATACNPWTNATFCKGDIVEGTVLRYVSNYAAVVLLTDNLTQCLSWQFPEFNGFLHIKRTPDEQLKNIESVLHVGDTVQALIVNVSLNKLEITLDVNELLSLREKQSAWREKLSALRVKQSVLRKKQSETVESSTLAVLDACSVFPTKKLKIDSARKEKKLLLVDDDLAFCQAWLTNLSHWNVRVRYCNPLTPEEWRKHLEREQFDACLLDCNLGLTAKLDSEFRVIFQQLSDSHPAMRLARMSAEGKSGVNGVLDKMRLFTPENLLPWLDHGVLPPENNNRRVFSLRWSIQGAESRVNERAMQLLRDCCRDNSSLRVLWVSEERPGYFAIHLAQGVEDSICRKAEGELGKTHIAKALRTGEEQNLPSKISGPLQEIFGEQGYIWIMPIKTNQRFDRALVCHSSTPLNDSVKIRIRDKKDHMIDLTQWQEAALALENREAFASSGLLLASQLHEIRTAASILTGISSRLSERLHLPFKPSDQELQQEIKDLMSAAMRVVDLSENGLEHVRPEQTNISDISHVIAETLRLIKGRMNALGKSINLEFCSNLPSERPLSLPYSAKFVEIPLINLLDNAFHHLGNRAWGKITISLMLDQMQPNQPLLIRVDDTGLGMNASQREKLFKVRKTGRGAAGSGLGLYLSRLLLEAVGGEITLEKSVRWLGSNFVIRLPWKT